MKTNIDQLTEAEWVVLRVLRTATRTKPPVLDSEYVEATRWLLSQMDIQCFFEACDALNGRGEV